MASVDILCLTGSSVQVFPSGASIAFCIGLPRWSQHTLSPSSPAHGCSSSLQSFFFSSPPPQLPHKDKPQAHPQSKSSSRPTIKELESESLAARWYSGDRQTFEDCWQRVLIPQGCRPQQRTYPRAFWLPQARNRSCGPIWKDQQIRNWTCSFC